MNGEMVCNNCTEFMNCTEFIIFWRVCVRALSEEREAGPLLGEVAVLHVEAFQCTQLSLTQLEAPHIKVLKTLNGRKKVRT